MNLCSDDHEEVCYDGIQCPACVAIESLQDEINDLEKQLDEMTSERDALETDR